MASSARGDADSSSVDPMHGYHQDTLKIITSVPAHDAAAASILDALEQAHDVTLPASVRAWYEFDGASELLRRGIDGQGIEVSQLGLPCEGFEEPVDTIAEGHLLVMIENQGTCSWAVRLDGSDDPPVDVEYDSMPEPEWQPFAASFSDFVKYLVAHTARSTHAFAASAVGGSADLFEATCRRLGVQALSVGSAGTGTAEHWAVHERGLISLREGLECSATSAQGIVEIVQALLAAGVPPENVCAMSEESAAALAPLMVRG